MSSEHKPSTKPAKSASQKPATGPKTANAPRKHATYAEIFDHHFGNLKVDYVDTHVHIDLILDRLNKESKPRKDCCGGESSITETVDEVPQEKWTWPRLIREHIRGPCAAVVTVSCEPGTHRNVLRLLNEAHPDSVAKSESKAETSTETPEATPETQSETTAEESKAIGGVETKLVTPQMYAAFGIHPHEAQYWTDEQEAILREAMQHPRVLALGECGLDYHYMNSPMEIQKHVFIRQIHMAVELKKPLVVHAREADEDTISILKTHLPADWRIHFHCNTSPAGYVQTLTAHFPNAFFGYTGCITFPSADEVRGAVAATPFNRLLLETDGPFMAPVPFRGRIATPGHIPFTAVTMAQIHNVTVEELLTQVRKNTQEMYGI